MEVEESKNDISSFSCLQITVLSYRPGHLDALLRGLVLGKLGKAGHKATLEEARRRFKDHVEGKNILSADLRSPVGYQGVWFPAAVAQERLWSLDGVGFRVWMWVLCA